MGSCSNMNYERMTPMLDRPSATLIGQDRETLTFKALLYLNIAVYARVYGLLCVVYMPLFGLVQARPWFLSSMWNCRYVYLKYSVYV